MSGRCALAALAAALLVIACGSVNGADDDDAPSIDGGAAVDGGPVDGAPSGTCTWDESNWDECAWAR